MKILKIPVHWTPDEADAINQLLDELKAAIQYSYGEEIVQTHKTIFNEEQTGSEEQDFNDEIPF